MDRSSYFEYQISDLGKVVTGKTPKTSIQENFGGDIPFLTPSDEMNYKHIIGTKRTLSDKGLLEVKRCLIPKDSVCVSCIGSDLGKVVKTDSKVVTNQQINSIIVDKEKFDPDYVYYLLKSLGNKLNYLSRTSTAVPIINKTRFSSQKISCPSLNEQKRIASLLNPIDSKIELNLKINKKIETFLRSLFNYWFIKFATFNNKCTFKDSEIGKIPSDLKIIKINDIPHFLETGKRPKGGAISKGLPSIGAENIKGLGLYDYSKTKYIPYEFASSYTKGKIKGYELLIYKDGANIPSFSIFGDGFPFDEMYINEHVFKLDLGCREYNIFAYFFMQIPFIKSQLRAYASKSAIPGLNTNDIKSLPIFSYDNELVKKFGNIALPFVKEILINSRQNLVLTKINNLLLNKYFDDELL